MPLSYGSHHGGPSWVGEENGNRPGGWPVSDRRKQVVALQAAAVAVLVLLVYLTLLAPDGTGPLSRIEAPGGEERVQSEGPRDRGGRGDGGTPAAGAAGVRVTAGDGDTEAGAGAGRAGPGAPADTRVVDTPRDDQYGDAVETLLRKLGDSSPARD